MNVRRELFAGVFFLTCFVGPLRPGAAPLDQWQMVAAPGNSIRGLAYKDGTFVAVGFSTNTAVSTNGTDWFNGLNGLSRNNGLYAVAAGAGQFVAVGPFNVILNSPDGLNWTRRDVGTNDEYWAVIYAGGRFVGVGFRNIPAVEPTVALVSADGLVWQRFGVPLNTTCRNVAYGKGVYVASGWPHSMYSTNGRDWTPLNGIGASAVAYGGGKFVMAGTSTGYASTNGMDWTQVTLPEEQYFTGTYANGLFMFGNGEKPYALLAISTNGTDWTSHTFMAANSYFAIRDIVFVNGHYYLGDQSYGRIWRSGRVAPVSPPVIADIVRRGNTTDLSFTAVPGFRYAVEFTDALNPPGWKESGVSLFAENNVLGVNDTNATNRMRFYRVRTE